MNRKKRKLNSWGALLLPGLLLPTVMLLCIGAGSVSIPVSDTLTVLWRSLWGLEMPKGISSSIVLTLRLPRVLCAALIGAALSLGGGAMQGLLKNPLADGSTLGVASGASLGAAVSILLGISLPGMALGGEALLAIVSAFFSMALILMLSYAFDHSLSTQTIILLGVIYSMFVSSLLSLLLSFAGEKLKTITFWTMGSLSGCNMEHVRLLVIGFLLFGVPLFFCAPALNAFLMGEENAANLGVNVKRVKIIVMICASALVGVSVSVAGCIGFVGLVVPHMMRILLGPDHRRLLPVSAIFGGIFLMLCDLGARLFLRPLEMPVGVVTSLIGAGVFLLIFYRGRRRKH